MKRIIIGTSLSGKTTLARYFNSKGITNVQEIDELLTELNLGTFPKDDTNKHTVLAPQAINKILLEKSVIFLTNADYLTEADFDRAKRGGFSIVLINVPKTELIARNEKRVHEEGYSDMSQYIDGMLEYMVFARKFADVVIDGTKTVQEIGDQILEAE